MLPPGDVIAHESTPRSPEEGGSVQASTLASILTEFLAQHPAAAVLEDGKIVFELESAQYRVAAEEDHCTLQLWSADRNLVRTVLAATERKGTLRLRTRRFGHVQIRTLTLVPAVERREPNRREPVRLAYMRLLQRVLTREFPEWSPVGFRTAMDLERSFGPAYARGSLVRGKEAWAVIGVGAAESQAVIDGILTLGVLWLEECRQRAAGSLLYKGLRVMAPQGAAQLTLARLPWMNGAAAQWELFELHETSEALQQRDPGDHGNLHTRLVHHPNLLAAQERFATAIRSVMTLVPEGEEHRVEQRLRSTAELGFLVHGLEFASARLSLAPASFSHVLEIRVGVGAEAMVLTAANQRSLATHVAELFHRRNATSLGTQRQVRPYAPGRGIGTFTGRPVHARLAMGTAQDQRGATGNRWDQQRATLSSQRDPLFRAAPERWLESVLRENLAPLTRSLAPQPQESSRAQGSFANDRDPDTWGNRVQPELSQNGWHPGTRIGHGTGSSERLIPRFDPRFVYTQVPAIAGAGDRGMLDLLGITDDGRLAVIEVKASDDLQLALQGLDYWIRVRHHTSASADTGQGQNDGLNDLQRHGYFSGVALSPLPPRLYLVAPALHVHPATETILRYLSPEVEWTLLALDERWRQQIRVVWRKSGGTRTNSP